MDDYQKEIQRGQSFINEVYQKMSKIAQEFADGEINRAQFHRLYDRYQQQIMTVAQMIAESDPSGWEEALESSNTESTLHLRKRLAAKAVGISVYNNQTGMPIETFGEFTVGAELIVPMLNSYRQATAEVFKAGVRSTAMENGRWLCFMAGTYTTLIALFSLEPSGNQIISLDHMHRDFELANAELLENGYSSPDELAYPFYSFITKGEVDLDEE